jgi:glycosyltransferase involved in cell wall biosynthesis
MRKILVNYDYQYAPFTTAFYYEKWLKRREDCKVFRVGEIEPFAVDIIINFMPCSNFYTAPGVFSCYWEGDSHVIRGEKKNLYEMVDLVFHAQPSYNHLYPDGKTFVLYHAADPELHRPFPKQEKLYEVGFLGNDTYPERQELLAKIAGRFTLLRGTEKPGLSYSRKLSSCRCIFNHSLEQDINMRIFEAMAIGVPLITDEVPFLDWMGKEGKHFETYRDWGELETAIRWFMEYPLKAKEMGLAARKHFLKWHTYERRVAQMLDIIDNCICLKKYSFCRK